MVFCAYCSQLVPKLCSGNRIGNGAPERMIRFTRKRTLMPDTTPIKEEARRLIDELPEDATWSDFARLVVERLRVEEGIADLDAGITRSSLSTAF